MHLKSEYFKLVIKFIWDKNKLKERKRQEDLRTMTLQFIKNVRGRRNGGQQKSKEIKQECETQTILKPSSPLTFGSPTPP